VPTRALALVGALLAAPAPQPQEWRLVATLELAGEASAAAFRDERHGIVCHCIPAAAHAAVRWTADAGRTWSPSPGPRCCFGIEVQATGAWLTGNRGEIRASGDGGRTWRPLTPFGGAIPNHATWLSFVDAHRGAIASHVQLAVTFDGGRTWREAALPPAAGTIAAVSLAQGGGGTVLRVFDPEGALWASRDRGRTWTPQPSPLEHPLFEFADGVHLAVRFFSPSEGLVVAMVEEAELPVGRIYRTRDGGGTWTEERVEGGLHPAAVTLSGDGELITTADSRAIRLYRRSRRSP
jgi:photosystem II stability/assembly factor-like uncharacterized protein